ncbi:hypothetical protein DFR44_1308 [Hydromonas duriensis]|uniref:Lipoprotein n=1 Tax=Hydromonas duriensis TaxID=1527608 RepID=A0A4R6Y4E4_9BURK|nr:hypothetical protein DFR44_1308 [Hydromonas duriensis]
MLKVIKKACYLFLLMVVPFALIACNALGEKICGGSLIACAM